MIPPAICGVYLTTNERAMLDMVQRRMEVSDVGLRIATCTWINDTRTDDAIIQLIENFKKKLRQLGLTIESYDGMHRMDAISKAKLRVMIEGSVSSE